MLLLCKKIKNFGFQYLLCIIETIPIIAIASKIKTVVSVTAHPLLLLIMFEDRVTNLTMQSLTPMDPQ